MSVEDLEKPPAYFGPIDGIGFRGGSRSLATLVFLIRVAMVVSSIGLILLALMVGLDVSVRYLSGRPLRGVLEISEVALVGITFLALPYVELTGRSMRVLFLIERLSPGMQRMLALLEIPVMLLFYYLILKIGLRDFIEAYEERFVRSGIIAIPLTIPIGFILLGAFTAVLATLFRGALLLFSPRQFILEE